jgi:hypothetical protein
MSQPVLYEKGDYKYRLAKDWEVQTPIENAAARIADPDDPKHPWVELTQGGLLKIREGYAWDGASGPTVDTRSSMRASLAHDALYQLERAGHLGQEFRIVADKLLHDLCVTDGMWPWRAKLWLIAVRKFAGYAAKRKAVQLFVAP